MMQASPLSILKVYLMIRANDPKDLNKSTSEQLKNKRTTVLTGPDLKN